MYSLAPRLWMECLEGVVGEVDVGVKGGVVVVGGASPPELDGSNEKSGRALAERRLYLSPVFWARTGSGSAWSDEGRRHDEAWESGGGAGKTK